MSRLNDTHREYNRLVQLLDQEIRKRSGSTKDLENCREALDVAFYLLGWSQFEYLVRQEAQVLIEGKSHAKTIERHAWNYLKEKVKSLSVRLRLDLIFHTKPTVLDGLYKDYELRNEAAHNYKKLPPEAKDISAWLRGLEDLVNNF
jgi:hypothetical protein